MISSDENLQVLHNASSNVYGNQQENLPFLRHVSFNTLG